MWARLGRWLPSSLWFGSVMLVRNEVTLQTPADELFAFVSDIARVSSCLPGARIEAFDDGEYRGSLRVKVGPIRANYTGTLRFVEVDPQARRVVLRARAQETAGHGQAEARIETSIAELDGASRIRMDTDLQIRGRVAQFGRGAMEKVAQRLFAEFANNLEVALRGGDEAAAQIEAAEGDLGRETRGDLDTSAPAVGQPHPARAPDPRGSTMPELRLVDLFTGPGANRCRRDLGAALIGFGYGYLAGRLRGRAVVRER